MCNAFSCIVLKDRTVLWKFGVDSHDEILKINNIPDNTADADKVKFCRVEISPKNRNYLNPDKWIFKIDQKPIPNWMEEEHELACWEAFRLWKQELDRILVYKQIVRPFEIEPPEITDEHIALLRVWASVRDSVLASVGDSVLASVGDSVWASVWDSVWATVRASVWASVWYSVRDSVWASVWYSVRDSVWASVWYSVSDSVGPSVWYSVSDSVGAYIGSFFVLPRSDWEYTEKIQTEGYPFQAAVTLWEMGLVPSFDGETWRLYSKDGIVWEGKI